MALGVGVASQQPPRKGFFSQVPGFRTGTPWKRGVAIIGYGFLALLLVAGIAGDGLAGALLILGIVGILCLATNAWGVRSKLPLFNSANRFLIATGWGLFVLVWFMAVALTAPPSSTNSQPTATRASATNEPSSEPSVAPTPSPTPTPTAKPTATPTATPTSTPVPATAQPVADTCGAPSNPWGFNFCGGGNFITAPPTNFCAYFACIANFWNGRGYAEECNDNMFGKSGGISGSCSYHGGNQQPLYAP